MNDWLHGGGEYSASLNCMREKSENWSGDREKVTHVTNRVEGFWESGNSRARVPERERAHLLKDAWKAKVGKEVENEKSSVKNMNLDLWRGIK